MKIEFVMKRNYLEESEEWSLNGEYLMTTNHDEHGSVGMEAVGEVIKDIARIMGGTIKEEDEV